MRLILLLLLLFSCSSPTEIGVATATIEDEKKVAHNYIPFVLEQTPPLENEAAQNYIDKLGKHLVESLGLNKNLYEYNFLLVHSDTPTSFHIPSGHILVTDSLFSHLGSEAQLVATLSNEIAHSQLKHVFIKTANKTPRSNNLLGSILGDVVTVAACKKAKVSKCQPPPSYENRQSKGSLLQKMPFIVYSEAEEKEAEQIAIGYYQKLKQDTEAYISFYAKVCKETKEINTGFTFPLAHPCYEGRMETIQKSFPKQDNKKTKQVTTNDTFLEIKKILSSQ